MLLEFVRLKETRIFEYKICETTASEHLLSLTCFNITACVAKNMNMIGICVPVDVTHRRKTSVLQTSSAQLFDFAQCVPSRFYYM